MYLCENYGLPEVARFWEQVVKMNEYQEARFAANMVTSMFNTVAGKRIALFGMAFGSSLGGWLGPLLPSWMGWLWFLLKVFLLLFFYVWMRWTLPRYRYDQLMRLGWKVFLPLSLAWLVLTAGFLVYTGKIAG